MEKEEHPGPKMVEISEDYLVFLHDELAENQARLRDVLGESGAKAVFSWSADRLVSTVKIDGSGWSKLIVPMTLKRARSYL
jgi:hypothetical protein